MEGWIPKDVVDASKKSLIARIVSINKASLPELTPVSELSS